MQPDAPRAEIIAHLRSAADILERALPPLVDVTLPCRAETVQTLLLTRVAHQGRSVAALLSAGADLDARMVMRSALEHLILAAWIAIDQRELSADQRKARTWHATTPDENAAAWVVEQLRRDKRRFEDHAKRFDGMIDPETRSAARAVRGIIDEHDLPAPPRIEAMAREVDAAWAGRLPGWPSARPRERAFMFTAEGMYASLYTAGSGSTHPALKALLDTFVESPDDETEAVRRRVSGVRDGRVDSFASITAYLLLYAAGIAEHLFGGSVLDDALRALGRFDVVRGPGRLLDEVAAVLGETNQRYGAAEGRQLRLERSGDRTTVALADGGEWTKVTHEPGPQWTLEANDRPAVVAGREDVNDSVVDVIARLRRAVRSASWHDDPEAWPRGAP